jgi:hypothetical protein
MKTPEETISYEEVELQADLTSIKDSGRKLETTL